MEYLRGLGTLCGGGVWQPFWSARSVDGVEVNKAAVPADDDWEDEVEEQPPDRCPACGVNRFGTYLWGLISDLFQEELIAQLSREEVRIVGCIIDDQTPRWFCRDCDADILEDGRMAPTEVRWEITYESLAAIQSSWLDDDSKEAMRRQFTGKFQELRSEMGHSTRSFEG